MVREIPPKKARQGGNGPRVLIVLVVSLIASIIAWGIADISYFTALEPDNPLTRTRDANVPSPDSFKIGQ